MTGTQDLGQSVPSGIILMVITVLFSHLELTRTLLSFSLQSNVHLCAILVCKFRTSHNNVHTGGTPIFVERSTFPPRQQQIFLATTYVLFQGKRLRTASTIALAASGSHLKGLSDTVVFMLLNKTKVLMSCSNKTCLLRVKKQQTEMADGRDGRPDEIQVWFT